MKDFSLFMKRALELAEFGRGKVSPNPMVGCIIVYQDKIIGEGYHKSYGGPHAEVNAIESVKDKRLLPESTLFVTLEPCSHFGKTPPCADLIIRHGIKKVVICNVDSNPLVGGKGIIKLKESGVDVSTGILEEEGKALNKRFFTFIEKQRPYIILKWAQTADGFIAREDYTSKWISNPFSRKVTHKWRSEEASIMVGTTTALQDDPQLTIRDWIGKSPVRIVIDRKLSLPRTLKLFDHSQLTLCYNAEIDEVEGNCHFIKLDYSFPVIPQIVKDLYQRKIQSLIVEGGAILLNEFIKLGVWDEIRNFQSNQTFGKGIKAPSFEGLLKEEIKLAGEDKVKIYIPNNTSNG